MTYYVLGFKEIKGDFGQVSIETIEENTLGLALFKSSQSQPIQNLQVIEEYETKEEAFEIGRKSVYKKVFNK